MTAQHRTSIPNLESVLSDTCCSDNQPLQAAIYWKDNKRKNAITACINNRSCPWKNKKTPDAPMRRLFVIPSLPDHTFKRVAPPSMRQINVYESMRLSTGGGSHVSPGQRAQERGAPLGNKVPWCHEHERLTCRCCCCQQATKCNRYNINS